MFTEYEKSLGPQDVNSTERRSYLYARRYTVCFLSARFRGIELWCIAKIAIPIRTIRGKIRGPSVSQSSQLSANTHDVEQRRRCYIIISSRCLAVQWRGRTRQFGYLSRKRERERIQFDRSALCLIPLTINFSFFSLSSLIRLTSPKTARDRKGNKGKAASFESREKLKEREKVSFIFLFIAKIRLYFLDKGFFAIYFFFVPIFRRYATSMISKSAIV